MGRSRWREGLKAFLRRQPVCVLLPLSVLMCFGRMRTYGESPETDLSTYWLVARELLHGKRLYAEVWDIKPPAIYWTYAAAQLAFSRPELCRYALWCAASLVTLGCVYALTRYLSRSRLAGLTAALLWAVVAQDCWLQANQPNTEVFINASLVGALLLLVRRDSRRSPLFNAFVAGLLAGWATLYKTVVLAVAPFWTFGILMAKRYADLGRAKAHKAAFWFWVGLLAAWGMTIAVFKSQGTLDALRITLLDWGMWYSGNPLENLVVGLHPFRLFPESAKHISPAALLALLGIRGLYRLRQNSAFSWMVLWAISCYMIYALPGRFYPHYYQVFLPLFCVMAGFSWWGVRQRHGGAPERRRGKQIVSGLVALQIVIQVPFYFRSEEYWSVAKYGPDFLEERNVGKQVSMLLHPHETLYVWGTNTGIIEASQRRPASGVFFAIPLLWGPMTAPLTQQVLRDFQEAPPELVVMNVQDIPAPATHPVVRWFAENCVRHRILETSSAKFKLFCRINGELQRRLELQLQGR